MRDTHVASSVVDVLFTFVDVSLKTRISTKTKHAPGDCLRTLDRIEEAPKAKSSPLQVRKNNIVRVGAGFELATFTARGEGSQPEIGSCERGAVRGGLYSIK